LDRREIVKLLALGSALPVIPGDAFALLRGIHQSLEASAKLKIFNAHQNATVIALAELILPQTDTAGAKAARVNEFIDKIVADWFSDEERRLFLTGLANVDDQTEELFGKDFVAASAIQQAEILKGLGDEMAQEASALIAAPRGYRGSAPEPDNNFYFMFRDLTLTGYFTSEVGFTQQLHEEIIPGHFEGCTPVSAAKPDKGS
jgi:Gluconate 2-dehydrogenase subunit 3